MILSSQIDSKNDGASIRLSMIRPQRNQQQRKKLHKYSTFSIKVLGAKVEGAERNDTKLHRKNSVLYIGYLEYIPVLGVPAPKGEFFNHSNGSQFWSKHSWNSLQLKNI